MTTAPSHAFDASSRAVDQEAQLLVKLLRTSRLALLYGDAGSGKTILLKFGLMPLLQRRASDRLAAAQAAAPSPPPLVDRRRRSASGAPKCRREFVVYFDDWTDTPLAALRGALYRATATGMDGRAAPLVGLTEVLELLSRRHDADFIILLDRFEEFLRAPAQQIDVVHFANELVEAINQADLPANFLISVSEEARPLLAGLGHRIPGFNDFSLKLTRRPDCATEVAAREDREPPAPSAAQPLPASIEAPSPSAEAPAPLPPPVADGPAPVKAKAKRHPSPKPPVKTEDIYALIEAQLLRLAGGQSGDAGMTLEPATPEPPEALPSRPESGHQPDSAAQAPRTQWPHEAVHADDSGTQAGSPAAVLPQQPGRTEPVAPTRRSSLQSAVGWLAHRLHLTGKPKHRSGR